MSGNPNMLPKETSADYCRRMGWGPGTRIVGDEGYGPTTITITAVGQEDILAKADGRDENTWTLEHRDWQLAATAPTDHTHAIAEAAREWAQADREVTAAIGQGGPNRWQRWADLNAREKAVRAALRAAADAERDLLMYDGSDDTPNPYRQGAVMHACTHHWQDTGNPGAHYCARCGTEWTEAGA